MKIEPEMVNEIQKLRESLYDTVTWKEVDGWWVGTWRGEETYRVRGERVQTVLKEIIKVHQC